MKYIIDIEDEYTKDWVNDTPMCKELCMPISVPNRQRTYHVSTGFKLEPYTEPDRKAIDLQYARDIENVARMNYNEGAKDAWEFAKKIGSFNGLTKHELDECFGHTTIQGVMTTYDTYQEAKEKYEAWMKYKSIRVGDEVEMDYSIDKTIKGIVLDKMPDEDNDWVVFTERGCVEMLEPSDLTKTGRHFNVAEELLKKMKEQ